MIDTKKSGYIVKTKHGKLGRTFHEKGIVNGKVPVYVATKTVIKKLSDGDTIEVPTEYSDKAILCSHEGLTQIGFID